MLDIHSHILPRVDDGATDDLTAIEMLKAAHQAGIDKIVATPHIYRRGVEEYRAVYGHLCALSKEIGIQIIPGCELSVRALAGCAISSDILSPFQIGLTHFILLEFPDDTPPVDWEYLVSDINQAGFHIIIAHPERCEYFTRSLSPAQGLLNLGCELQLDALSFAGSRFSIERRSATKLLDNGYASYIASDAHRPRDYETFYAVQRYLGKKWPSDGLLEKLI